MAAHPDRRLPGTPDTALIIQDATDRRHRIEYAGGPPGVWGNWDALVSGFVGRDVYLFGVDSARQKSGWFAFGRPRPIAARCGGSTSP